MHDRNGTPLKAGDRVLIPAVVKQVSPEDGYCNCQLETEYGRRPDGQKESIYAINTGVVVLLESAPAPAEDQPQG